MPLQPTEKIWMNGNLLDWDKAQVHVLTHAMHYGSSVFEGIRCYAGPAGSAVFRLRDHIERLMHSAKIYRMEIPFTVDDLSAACLDTIRANRMTECYIRPLVFRGYGEMGVFPLKNPVETCIAVWPWGRYLGDEALARGVDVQVSSWTRMAPNTFPALAKVGGNYAASQLIKMEAHLNGFAEGICLTMDGHVAEGSGENVFLMYQGKLFTPPVASSILQGITRDTVIEVARNMGVTVTEEPIPREMLYLADEVFLTGTAAEVTPVRSVDRIAVGTGARGPVTEKIQSAYLDLVKGRTSNGLLSAHPDWLTRI